LLIAFRASCGCIITVTVCRKSPENTSSLKKPSRALACGHSVTINVRCKYPSVSTQLLYGYRPMGPAESGCTPANSPVRSEIATVDSGSKALREIAANDRTECQ